MPKKRTTRAKAANISKPKDNAPNKLTKEEEKQKKEQLEIILKEFDNKAKVYQRAIDKQKIQWITFINQRYLKFTQSIHPDIGKMTVEEFAAAGGTFQKAMSYIEEKRNKKPLDKVRDLQNLLRLPRGLPHVIEEDGEGDYVKQEMFSTCKTKQTMKSTITSSTGVGRKSKRAGAATPLNTLSRNQWGQTPLITPKFNPNLPHTPENIRDKRPGEHLMSITGSPVHAVNVDQRSIANELARIDISPGRMEKVLEIIKKNC